MNIKLKSLLQEAIDGVIQSAAEDDLWTGEIHPELTDQMMNAAEQVFDAAMKAQEYAEKEAI